jgi:phosphoglycolate phosphatase
MWHEAATDGGTMRTAIFDLDGTLADTSGDLIAAANATLREAGITGELATGQDEATALRGGRPMLRLGLERAGQGIDETFVEALYPRLLEHYGRAVAHHTRLYDGAEAALVVLAAAGWRLGICTNKPQRLADLLLATLGVSGLFRAVLGADALPVRKPDPRHLTETILRAGGATSSAVMIGDTPTDRDAARAAGVPCVLVGFGPEGAGVVALDPIAVLGHYDELPDMLETLLPLQAPATRRA